MNKRWVDADLLGYTSELAGRDHMGVVKRFRLELQRTLHDSLSFEGIETIGNEALTRPLGVSGMGVLHV